MRCPNCGFQDDKVVDSRAVRDGAGVRRRRVCLGCGFRFTTYESVIPSELMVVKRNGVREEFDPDKLRKGLSLACHKRPIPAGTVDKVVEDITLGIQRDFDKEVPSEEIGRRVMMELRRLDQVAYVRFASIYRKFKDVDEFVAEIRTLNDPAPQPGRKP